MEAGCCGFVAKSMLRLLGELGTCGRILKFEFRMCFFFSCNKLFFYSTGLRGQVIQYCCVAVFRDVFP